MGAPWWGGCVGRPAPPHPTPPPPPPHSLCFFSAGRRAWGGPPQPPPRRVHTAPAPTRLAGAQRLLKRSQHQPTPEGLPAGFSFFSGNEQQRCCSLPVVRGASGSRWHSSFFLNRNGAFEDKQCACRHQRPGEDRQKVEWQGGDHIRDGQDEDATVRDAQVTAEEDRQSSRRCRAQYAGWNHTERSVFGAGNGPFGT